MSLVQAPRLELNPSHIRLFPALQQRIEDRSSRQQAYGEVVQTLSRFFEVHKAAVVSSTEVADAEEIPFTIEGYGRGRFFRLSSLYSVEIVEDNPESEEANAVGITIIPSAPRKSLATHFTIGEQKPIARTKVSVELAHLIADMPDDEGFSVVYPDDMSPKQLEPVESVLVVG